MNGEAGVDESGLAVPGLEQLEGRRVGLYQQASPRLVSLSTEDDDDAD